MYVCVSLCVCAVWLLSVSMYGCYFYKVHLSNFLIIGSAFLFNLPSIFISFPSYYNFLSLQEWLLITNLVINVDLDLLSEQWNDFHTGLTNKQKFNWDPPKNPVIWVICVVVFNFSRLVRFIRDWAQFKLNIIEVELGIESFDKRWNERWYLCLFPVGCQCKRVMI